MEDHIVYSVGFMFSEDRRHVVLIEKQKPDWQKGCLNGVGGKVEEGETPIQAMVREFQEETSALTIDKDWREFLALEAYNPGVSERATVHFFRTFASDAFLLNCLRTTTNEKVYVMDRQQLDIVKSGGYPTVPNLRWVLPMAAWMELDKSQVKGFKVQEVGGF